MFSSRPDTLDKTCPAWIYNYNHVPRTIYQPRHTEMDSAWEKVVSRGYLPDWFIESGGETYTFFPYVMWENSSKSFLGVTFTSVSDLRYYARLAERIKLKAAIATEAGVHTNDLIYRLLGENPVTRAPMDQHSDDVRNNRNVYGRLISWMSDTSAPHIKLYSSGYAKWLKGTPYDLTKYRWDGGAPMEVHNYRTQTSQLDDPRAWRAEDQHVWQVVEESLNTISGDLTIRISEVGGWDLEERIRAQYIAKVEKIAQRYRIIWDSYQL
jgi:hypothetical protein